LRKIVDLIRNDLSRIAKRGSVNVPALFSVETYPTLHTLTSTVRAEVREDRDAVDVLRALFPCGSITGAPKIRAMEIIDELESDRRGAYTGSIGWMAPDGSAAFNVAIRTLTVSAEAKAEIGLGSAVVYDSNVESEGRECETKGAFVTAGAASFVLLETMRYEPGEGLVRLDLHLARLKASAAVFGYRFDQDAIQGALDQTLAASEACIVRLALAAGGGVNVTRRALPAPNHTTALAALAPLPVANHDFRLRHKTSARDFYDAARVASGAEEVVFVDEAGFVTEGSFTNVFVERKGVLLTPPVSRGLLPGILRATLLEAGRAREADLRSKDLAAGFLIGNSVRGLVPARIALTERQSA
jgi:para-aminobenzoate synthetase/4-amino-4-deoxychorismate lyase